MQFCGLLVTGLALPNGISRWVWVPIAVALACTVLRPVLNCFVLTHLGTLRNILAGVVQVFVILQRGSHLEQEADGTSDRDVPGSEEEAVIRRMSI
jgi:hypothetical protein